MRARGRTRSWFLAMGLCTAVTLFFGHPGLLVAHTPESPKVAKMVERATGYLEKNTDERLGGIALIGLVFVKQDYPPTHPRIAAAVQACRAAAKLAPDKLDQEHGVYSIGIALIFLCEAGHEQYRPEIEKLIAALDAIQREAGGWGYAPGRGHDETGDTSMTQYAVLGLWTAHSRGIPVPADSIRDVAMWLIRTQNPDGAWGYQGNDPGGDGGTRVKQPGVRHSMAAAGLGSVHVCADLMNISLDKMRASENANEPLFPAALKPVGDPRRASVAPAGNMPSLIGRAIADGNHWFDENYTIEAPEYLLYYLYALERYRSFQELLTKKADAEPQWYSEGVDYLAKYQSPNGQWAIDSYSPNGAVDTALATLFLLRSTKKAIEAALNYGDGRLAGGRGLPKDLANARIKRGKIVGEQLTASADDILSLLEDPENSEFDKLADDPESVLTQTNIGSGQAEVERLRRVIRSGTFEARIVAVKALATKRNLDNVPVLIYALSDPDPRVVIEARDALRFISRKFEGLGPPDNPDFNQTQAAIKAWKDWYRSIKPDAQFVE